MRWIIRILGALVVLIFLALVAFLLIPAERIAGLVSERITQATGRTVSISGEARPTLWPNPGVVIEGLRIGNPVWAGETPMIAAERARVGIAWGGLFTGDIRIQSAVLDNAQIMLVRAMDGRTSWNMGSNWQIGLEEALIRDGRVRYLDRAAGADWDVSELEATLQAQADGPLTIEANARLNGVPLVLDTTVDGTAGLLAGEARPVQADLRWQGGSAAFNGDLALDATMDGMLSLTAEDLGPLFALSGGDMPALPQGLGRDRVEITGAFRRAQEGSLHLRDGEMRLDETVLNAALDLMAGENRPMLRGTITGGVVTLPGLIAPAEDGRMTAWPQEIMDVSGLFTTDADLTIRTERLDMGAVRLSDIDLRATINRGRLVFDIASITAYEGQVAGRFVINGRGGLSVGGDLTMTDAAMEPLLSAVAGYTRLEGAGSASVEFLGVGDDMFTIMDGLEAEGAITLRDGVFEGLDLDDVTRDVDAAEGQSPFDRVSGEFIVTDGVLRSDDLRVFAPWGIVDGVGEAEIADMTLDFSMVPVEIEGRGPVRLRGPWSAVEAEVDAEALQVIAAEAEAAAEEARLEAEARAQREVAAARATEEILERAVDFLGVQIDTSDTPDEILRRLEDAAVDGFERLIFSGGDGN